jgi:hypothetical protein
LPTGIHYAANLTTSAFGEATGPTSIWTVKPSVATAPKGVDWATLFPVFALLAFAIICVELYMRQKTNAEQQLCKRLANRSAIGNISLISSTCQQYIHH